MTGGLGDLPSWYALANGEPLAITIKAKRACASMRVVWRGNNRNMSHMPYGSFRIVDLDPVTLRPAIDVIAT